VLNYDAQKNSSPLFHQLPTTNPSTKTSIFMKQTSILSLLLLLCVSFGLSSFAQTSSGIITYEGMRKLDPSLIRVVINGDVVEAGSPDAPADLPDVISFSQQLVFANNSAKEVKDNPGPVVRRFMGTPGDAGPGEALKIDPPFIENTFLDLAGKKYVRTLEIKKNGKAENYQTDEPYKKAEGWKDAGKTKKIAGYSCKKATATWKGETYSIWYTTDLNFTYSPINGLVPDKGVVLEIEGSSQSFKATKIENKAVSESQFTPSADVQVVSNTQYEDLRSKAQADFRQKMMSGELERN
jgi:hypothetical protein